MKSGIRVALAAVLYAGMVSVAAGRTLPGSTSRSPLVVGSVSERLSVGVEYDRIKREVQEKNGITGLLEADAFSGYAGYDFQPWLTVFLTVGGVEIKSEPWLETDAGLKASLGISAYLWEADLLTPPFMAGRFSIKATAEAGRYESDTGIGEVRWNEVLIALPIGYEKFDRYPASSVGVDTSLALYAGPAYSYLKGVLKESPSGGRVIFDGKDELGLVAGADVFFSPQFSVGAKVLVFDEVSYGASVRFHF